MSTYLLLFKNRLIIHFSRFSADTAPSKTLCLVGKDSTVLIHEATMADDESGLAKKKAHSTIGQAIAAGKK